MPTPLNFGEFPGVRFIALLIALDGPLQAALLAHVQTTQGKVTVALQYDKAPQAVANFITLAQGARNHVNPLTGAVTNTPYYIGEKFFRVLNQTGFKIAQTGSGTGTNIGGPGFTFKDEFNPTLTHIPYVLSMANSGPNSNGSQIFFTGNATIPSLDNIHTIFGLVTEPASRVVVDAIHAAGDDGTTITGITFSRTDAAAVAFNEQGQNLPTVTRPNGYLAVTPGVSAIWNLNPLMSTGAIFRAFRSTTLASGSWSELGSARQHVGIGAAQLFPAVLTAPLDNAAAPSAFYNLTVARHPNSVAPSTLVSRTVAIAIGGGVLYYSHNTAGTGGNGTYVPIVGDSINFTFVTYSFQSAAHDISFIVENIGVTLEPLLIKIGCDSANNTQIDGRHSTQSFDNLYGWQPWSSGPAAISR